MIWYWLNLVFHSMARFLLPLPASATARVRPESPCPACGNTNGTIRCVERGGRILVQHTCGTCGGRWHEQPVVRLDRTGLILAAVPRTELEFKEEYSTRVAGPQVRPQPVEPVERRMPPAWVPPDKPVEVPPMPSIEQIRAAQEQYQAQVEKEVKTDGPEQVH